VRAHADREHRDLRVRRHPEAVLEVERAVLVDAVRDEDDGLALARGIAHVAARVVEGVVQCGESSSHLEPGQPLPYLLRP